MVLTLDQVRSLTTQMQSEILESPAFLSAELLAKYGIRVITGIEFKDLQFAIKRIGGSTRAYKKGDSLTSTAGKVEEKELVVKTVWNRYVDNIEDYREKEPFHVDANNRYVAPASETKIRIIGTEFQEDVLSNLFYGKRDTNNTYKGLSLYDGLLQKLTAWKAEGHTIPSVATGAFSPVTEETKADNWEAFVEFVTKLPAPFKKAMRGTGAGIKVLCSATTKAYIVESYTRTFPSLKPTEVDAISLQFINLEKVTLTSCDLLGEGSMLMAVIDGTLDFGVDSLNSLNSVKVGEDQSDFSNIIFEIKSSIGTRVIDESKVCFNDQENTFTLSDYVGDEVAAEDDITMKFSAANGLAVKE